MSKKHLFVYLEQLFGNGIEGFAKIFARFRTGLPKAARAQFARHGLPFGGSHGSLAFQVAFIAEDEVQRLSPGIFLDACLPRRERLQSFPPGNVVHEDASKCPGIEGGPCKIKLLLPAKVPELEFHGIALRQHHICNREISADSLDVLFCEFMLGVLQNERGFADVAVAANDGLENVTFERHEPRSLRMDGDVAKTRIK